MSDAPDKSLPISPARLTTNDTALLVVDVQEKLIGAMSERSRLLFNCRRLLRAANTLSVTTIATEQYPQGLGPTVGEIAEMLDSNRTESKKSFSCGECGGLFQQLRDEGITRIVVCGIETHVCVLQTVLDLIADQWDVYLPVDAVDSRYPIDRETAIRRMELAGAVLTTTEATLFEWCGTANHPKFKEISRLVREPIPE